jgi:hypothetical protein
MNQDFVDLLRAFVDHDVRFMVVGAYALAIHGRPRATGRIDMLTDLTGLTFDEAWPGRITRPFGDVTVGVIGLADFIRNKRATGRAKDLGDIEGLE